MSELTQRDENTQAAWPRGIAAITLFVEDLAAAKRFYSDVFQLPVIFEDGNSTVFKFDDTLVNLLKVSEAPALVAPATVAKPPAKMRLARSCSPPRPRPGSRSTPSSFSAAMATSTSTPRAGCCATPSSMRSAQAQAKSAACSSGGSSSKRRHKSLHCRFYKN